MQSLPSFPSSAKSLSKTYGSRCLALACRCRVDCCNKDQLSVFTILYFFPKFICQFCFIFSIHFKIIFADAKLFCDIADIGSSLLPVQFQYLISFLSYLPLSSSFVIWTSFSKSASYRFLSILRYFISIVSMTILIFYRISPIYGNCYFIQIFLSI